MIFQFLFFLMAPLCSYILYFLGNALLIFLKMFNVNRYIIRHEPTMQCIFNSLPKRSSAIADNEMEEFIYGWPYIGYIRRSDSGNSMWIVTTSVFYERVSKRSRIENDDALSEIEYISVNKHAWGYDYANRKIDCKYVPRPNQKLIINEIVKKFEEKTHHVCYLHGDIGVGKSIIGQLLTKILKGSLYVNFNPTKPGEDFEKLYQKANPTKIKPLVIVIEEFDVMIRKIHEGHEPRNNKLPTSIVNKSDYNTFMDMIDRGLYPYLILILTSNKDPEEIMKLDPSYIRPGRVNSIKKVSAEEKLD